ncbi:PH, RCC1 and FYVE domains-containing protein 1 [Cardamine amara subsp. amara]|uniref:PH, RCC1 and FYVE domains-containing protein 1 n=1 Tax=Cardamine amara subsp. amara TaxID=228776 RepID=A0ABD1B8C8_CARAN
MGEQQISATVPRDRTDEQAILALKKGAQLLKCRRRGNPKFCPFKLSMDEKYLIWYSGQEERQLRLSSVITIVRGQITPNFQKQAQSDRKEQSFSLIYANGEHTLDLICKDKVQADSWFKGLRAVITKHHNIRASTNLRTSRGAQSCISSPAGFIRRKQNLGLLEETPDFTQIRSLCGSPSTLLEERCLSNGLSCSSDSFAASDGFGPVSPYYETDYDIRNSDCDRTALELSKHSSQRFSASPPPSIITQPITKSNVLKDIMIWGAITGLIDGSKNQSDALSPKLLESATMFDVKSISLGAKHAALVTRQGEVFCWGNGSSGKLGVKVNIDIDHPKRVESLEDVAVQSVACSDHQTCAVTESGELYLWGIDGGAIEQSGRQFLTRKISDVFGGSLSVLSVACGAWHTAIVTSSGQLFTYGSGTFGVLGHGSLESVTKPKEVESLRRMKVISVSCGPWHTAAIVETTNDRKFYNAKSCGKLFTWGDGDKGRLGHADSKKKLVPTCVTELVDHDFTKVSCGWTLTVALSISGTVYTMGSSIHGQLGCPRAKDKSINVVLGNLTRQFVKDIASGSHHVSVLTSFGSVYTWGKGANGQLGLGDVRDRNSPVLVESLNDSSCKSAFGFTRKKHNCYNCGLLFCNACSGKKAVNASLAPNKSKLSRVCDSCFDHLWSITEFSKNVKMENHTPKMQMVTRKASEDWTESESENQLQNLLQGNRSSDGQIRWGQVSVPSLFHFDNISRSSSMNLSVSSRRPSSTKISTSSDSNKILIEEIERLKAEIKNLQRQCELGNEKIEECQKELDNTWEVANEEAEKSKAAKEIIKALASKLQTNKEKPSNPPKTGIACNPSQVSPIFDDSMSIPCLTPITTTRSQSENKQLLEKCVSKSTNRDSNIKLLVDATPTITRTGHNQNGTQDSTAEQVEQYEPGVYITFTALPCGQKTLKRVRFSRKKFSEKEAQRWWEEKQVLVYKKYDAET